MAGFDTLLTLSVTRLPLDTFFKTQLKNIVLVSDIKWFYMCLSGLKMSLYSKQNQWFVVQYAPCALLLILASVLLLQVHFLMALAANWGYLKDASRMQKYEDIKSKEEQELHDIHSTRSKERLNAYT